MIRLLEALVRRHAPALRPRGGDAPAERPSRLENWQILRFADSTGAATLCVSGEIYGDPRFDQGAFVTTSAAHTYRHDGEELVIVTRTGSEYLLGKPHAAETFAKSRLARYLDAPVGAVPLEDRFVAARLTPPEPYRARRRTARFRH